MSQRGNILFLILLAVVLFAALSYAITSSMRGGGNDASKETAEMAATQILQNATAIEQAMMRARTVEGIPDYGFNLKGSNSGSTQTNTTCTVSACKIFSDQGGSVASVGLPQAAWDDAAKANGGQNTLFVAAQILDIGTAAEDLVINLPHINLATCQALNRAFGLTHSITAIESWGGYVNYTGTLTAFPDATGIIIGNDVTALRGQRSACFYNGVSNGYTFYHVLIAR